MYNSERKLADFPNILFLSYGTLGCLVQFTELEIYGHLSTNSR